MSISLLEGLKNELKKSVSQHFKALNEKFPEEKLYGYSLYTSDDISSIGPVANKVSDLTKDKDDTEYNYYRYSPDEWSEWDDFGMFEQVNEIISKLYEEMNNNFANYKKSVLRKAIDVLYELELEGVFGPKNDERFLIVWVTDSSDESIHTSAKKLNTQKVYKEFASEFI